jgi:hypothetical protein
MEFEFGQTDQSDAFFDRNPKFMPAFERLMTVANKCFGREIKPKNRPEDIIFWLGHSSREDYLEVVFLAVHGYGLATSKILRGLYERAVTLAYLIEEPDKAERFVRFAAIQEHRALEAALKFISETEFDEMMGPANSVALIRQRYDEVKSDFGTTLCKKCGTKRIQSTWDLDVAAMVHKVGDPYNKLFLGAYTIPNFQIHATLASTSAGQEGKTKTARRLRDAEFALLNATCILIHVIRSQTRFFSLNLDVELENCKKDFVDMCNTYGARGHFN